MKKSKILAAVLLLAMFSSVFGLATTGTTVQIGSSVADIPNTTFTPDATGLGAPLGDNGTWVADVTSSPITFDSDYSDWAALPNYAIYGGINVSLAYDATYVYALISWKDTTNDIDVGRWNKTGNVNANYGEWAFLDGADDVLQIGFSEFANGTNADVMIWTASNRTQAGYMFECNATGHADGGALPYLMNTNTTGTFVDAQPAFINDGMTTPTPADPKTIANGTKVDAWHDTDTITPTGSQTDTEILVDWNTTMEDHYFAQIRRQLNTGQTDDYVIDFTGDMYFWLGGANGDDTFDMMIPMQSYLCCLTNEEAKLTFTDIAADPVTEALVITGGMYDDYLGFDLYVELSGWADTYGPGTAFDITVNEATGNYSFLFFFDEFDMPLGEHTVFVTLDPLYGAAIELNQTIEIDDIKAPNIEGIVDLQDRYADGIPLDEDYAVITVGLSDDYCANDDIAAYLYSYQGNDVALKTDMVQFSPGSTTFVANLTVDHTPGVVNNYTYFIQAWDTNLNKVTSDRYWVLAVSAAPTPAFGIIAGLFGLAGAAFIVKKLKK